MSEQRKGRFGIRLLVICTVWRNRDGTEKGVSNQSEREREREKVEKSNNKSSTQPSTQFLFYCTLL